MGVASTILRACCQPTPSLNMEHGPSYASFIPFASAISIDNIRAFVVTARIREADDINAHDRRAIARARPLLETAITGRGKVIRDETDDPCGNVGR